MTLYLTLSTCVFPAPLVLPLSGCCYLYLHNPFLLLFLYILPPYTLILPLRCLNLPFTFCLSILTHYFLKQSLVSWLILHEILFLHLLFHASTVFLFLWYTQFAYFCFLVSSFSAIALHVENVVQLFLLNSGYTFLISSNFVRKFIFCWSSSSPGWRRLLEESWRPDLRLCTSTCFFTVSYGFVAFNYALFSYTGLL